MTDEQMDAAVEMYEGLLMRGMGRDQAAYIVDRVFCPQPDQVTCPRCGGEGWVYTQREWYEDPMEATQVCECRRGA